MNLALPHLSIKHLLPYLCVFLWALVCYVFFQTTYAYHFFYQEQNQLFLLSWTYCADYLRRPAWLASLVGDFLTQFYYYRYCCLICHVYPRRSCAHDHIVAVCFCPCLLAVWQRWLPLPATPYYI